MCAMEMLSEGNAETDVARGWLQAGQSFAANVADEEFSLFMAELVTPAVDHWPIRGEGHPRRLSMMPLGPVRSAARL